METLKDWTKIVIETEAGTPLATITADDFVKIS